MRILSRPILSLALLGQLAMAVSACGTLSDQLTPLAFTSLMPGWESRFKLEWTVEPDQGETRRIRGQISSTWGDTVNPLRVLGQALDPSGNVVGQRIVWVPEGVGGFGHAYFEIPHLPVADHYRVTVWDYTIIEGDSGFP